jgi:hypothetical protein
MHKRDFLSATLVSVMLAASAAGQSAPAQPAELTALNDAFRAAYAEAKQRVLAANGPTLIVSGDNFSLLRDGRRLEANAGTPVYDPVKTIAHIPLAIYVILTPGDGAVAAERIATLAHLCDLIPPAEQSLDRVKLPAADLARQKQIVTESLAFMARVMASRNCARKDLFAFTRGMKPLVMENVAEATRAQLDATHAVVSAWRREMSADEWARLHVLIIGPHMPREDLAVTQYFLRLLKEPGEGHRVVYAESQWQEQQAMDLLGTHLLDGSVGDAFFDDYMRMHRDLLGDAARSYLKKLLP